ncbi:hypothetical protein [Haladaptatus sp. DYSN1]|uniref:hypothetical protein n=1 Tax=unclassified Haladaptatus TaxID=2622732 RepID=UPI002406F42A|nr:hypothetical protein [Haladaptatus sp. DYSN1]
MFAQITRRDALKTVAFGGLLGLAGCTSLLSGGPNDIVVINDARVAVTADVTISRVPDDEVVIREAVEISPNNSVYYPNVLGEGGSYRININVRKGPSAVFTASPEDRPVEVVITSTSVDFYPGRQTPET